MKIIEHIENLKREFSRDCCVQNNGTLLLGLQTDGEVELPRKHVVFPPLTYEELEWNISRYRRTFPKQLKELLEYANGFNLFAWHFMIRDIAIVQYNISVYGFQTIEMRKKAESTMLIPFDIATEDLRRPKGCPNTLLRIGSSDIEKGIRKYIFIDTETGETLMSDSEMFSVTDKWSSLDECLCELFLRY